VEKIGSGGGRDKTMNGRTICLDQLEFRLGRGIVGCASDITLVERKHAATLLRQQDWDALRAISQQELELRFTEVPDRPTFINPQVTVVGVQADDLFYSEVLRLSGWWHRDMARLLSHSGVKKLAMKADWATKLLVFDGTLIVNGQIFLSGFWPNRQLRLKRLRKTPFGKPTVPPEYIGLVRNANGCPREDEFELDDARSHLVET
jgi:hypothetical protein